MVVGGAAVVVVVGAIVVEVVVVEGVVLVVGVSAVTVVSAPEGCSSAAVRSGTAAWDVPDGIPACGAVRAHPVNPNRIIPASHTAARFPPMLLHPFLKGKHPRILYVKNSTIFGKKVDYDKIVTPVYKLVNSAEKE